MDADPRLELGLPVLALLRVELAEGAVHGERRPYRPVPVVGTRLRGAENGEDRVADELVDRPSLLLDRPRHQGEVAVEHRHDAVGLHPLREGGVAADVAEDDRDLELYPPHPDPPLQHLAGERPVHVAVERLHDPLPLPQADDHLVHPVAEEPDLVAGVHPDGRRKVAAVDGLHGLAHGAGAPADHHAERDHDGEPHHEAEDGEGDRLRHLVARHRARGDDLPSGLVQDHVPPDDRVEHGEEEREGADGDEDEVRAAAQRKRVPARLHVEVPVGEEDGQEPDAGDGGDREVAEDGHEGAVEETHHRGRGPVGLQDGRAQHREHEREDHQGGHPECCREGGVRHGGVHRAQAGEGEQTVGGRLLPRERPHRIVDRPLVDEAEDEVEEEAEEEVRAAHRVVDGALRIGGVGERIHLHEVRAEKHEAPGRDPHHQERIQEAKRNASERLHGHRAHYSRPPPPLPP